MKIVEQEAVYLPHEGNPYEFIEDVGRTCYKSEKRGNPTGFVKELFKSKHWAMLEHWYVYFKLDNDAMRILKGELEPYEYKFINIADTYVSGSFRSFLDIFEVREDTWRGSSSITRMMLLLTEEYPDIFEKYKCDVDIAQGFGKVELITRDEVIKQLKDSDNIFGDMWISMLVPHTFRFITNRGVSHELVRMRICSFAQESQRYVGYDKEKFGSEITVIKPLLDPESKDYEEWKYAMEWCETVYMNLRERGVAPQIARGVLPNDCKTEIVVTATEEEWQHIVDLRYHGTTGAPHPQIKELIGLAYPVLVEKSEGRVS